MKKIIFYLFAFLLFFVPLILWPYTSEVFEFNKMVFVYAVSAVLTGAWVIRCIIERKIIFRRTILDIPLLLFLTSQIISTFISIDFYTSVFGYYSRFNGGLLSTICYLLLYWVFVSNFDAKDALNLIKVWLASAAVVSIYGVLEHFGIDKNIWVQDVQSRVFSSLGQPNWLAAWLVALIPITWAFTLRSKVKSVNFWIYFSLSLLFFWTLIFTKSRSGLVGFAAASIIFWGINSAQNIKKINMLITPLVIIGFSFIGICLISGTQWTPTLASLLSQQKPVQQNTSGGTALETGGTESGTIRKIVWTGAIELWKHYPVFGTGVETFAYSYYLYRPVAHNVTSEWDFIYNKAHNEFLNMAANSGAFGLVSYLILIGFIVFIFFPKTKDDNSQTINIALLGGFVSLAVTNFFGFSVVPTQIEFFLFPAIAVALGLESEKLKEIELKLSGFQKIGIAVSCSFTLLLSYFIFNYWYSDILFSKAKSYNAVPRPDLAIPLLNESIRLEPYQAIYNGELAGSFAAVAMAYNQNKDATNTAEFTNLAVEEIQKAVSIAPANVNLRRAAFGIYVRLSTINENFLINARDTLNEAIKMAPTDAKLYFNLGIADANLNDLKAADANFKKSIELKPNYGAARDEYAALLAHLGRNEEAKQQLNYVLKYIDPNDAIAKRALENLK